MVNRIINGDFSGGVNDPDDRDPNGWVTIEDANDPNQVAADVLLSDYQGWMAFNSGNSGFNGEIRQTVTGVRIGETVSFSFDFKERGARANQPVSMTYSIVDDLGNTIAGNRVWTNSTAFNTPSTTITESFTAQRSSYTIIFEDTSRRGFSRDILIDNVVFDVPCFCSGTMIETDHGPVAVEKLSIGDLLKTRDHGYQPLRWIGSRVVTKSDLKIAPRLLPIRIRAGALGPNTPVSDLFVSPQHRILVCSTIAQRMFGTSEILTAAKHLCAIEGIDVVEDTNELHYFHLMFERHEVIYSNGAETESLYTGEQALKSVGPAAREEIFTLFPELKDRAPDRSPLPARPLVPGKLARKLAARHSQNGKQLVV